MADLVEPSQADVVEMAARVLSQRGLPMKRRISRFVVRVLKLGLARSDEKSIQISTSSTHANKARP